MSKYHRDEFDRVPESSSRQGVHRSRLEPPKGGGLALIVTTGVIALIIGAAAYFILPNLGLFSGTEPAATGQTTGDMTAQATDPATAQESEGAGDDTAEDAEPSSEATPSQPQSPSASATATGISEPVANKSVPVVVLNSTGMAGMAGAAGDRLAADGWPVSFIGNWGGAPQSTSSVFYNGADQLVNAQAIGELLNISQFIPTTQIQDPLTVVIGPGFQ